MTLLRCVTGDVCGLDFTMRIFVSGATGVLGRRALPPRTAPCDTFRPIWSTPPSPPGRFDASSRSHSPPSTPTAATCGSTSPPLCARPATMAPCSTRRRRPTASRARGGRSAALRLVLRPRRRHDPADAGRHATRRPSTGSRLSSRRIIHHPVQDWAMGGNLRRWRRLRSIADLAYPSR